MLIHKKSEIDTQGFHDFLKKAVESFHKNLKRMTTKPEDVMPWKVNGERWHLGEKGFPPGRRIHWDRALLPRLLEVVRAVEPKLEVVWDNRTMISLRVPGATRAWSYWKTKDNTALECRFHGKEGQFNLSQVEKFGIQPEFAAATEGEWLRLAFQHDNQVHANELKDLLREHLRGFREAFGKS